MVTVVLHGPHEVLRWLADDVDAKWGKIPCRLVGTHRRIKMADLMTYQNADDTERKAVLDELAAEAQKHGLGY